MQTPRLLCADFPVQTLSVPGMKIVIYFCRALEFVGLGHFSWLLYYLLSFNLDSSINDQLGIRKAHSDDSSSSSDDSSSDDEKLTITKGEWRRMEDRLESQEQKLDLLLRNFESMKKESAPV
jgi:hypothetical protein